MRNDLSLRGFLNHILSSGCCGCAAAAALLLLLLLHWGLELCGNGGCGLEYCKPNNPHPWFL
jgi:hypothetical protein